MSCIPIPVLHVCDNVISKGNAVISEWGGGGGGGGGGGDLEHPLFWLSQDWSS